jgi:hypothetical protein
MLFLDPIKQLTRDNFREVIHEAIEDFYELPVSRVFEPKPPKPPHVRARPTAVKGDSRFVTLRSIAARAGLAYNTLYNEVFEGKLKAHHVVYDAWIIDKGDIIEWLRHRGRVRHTRIKGQVKRAWTFQSAVWLRQLENPDETATQAASWVLDNDPIHRGV